jgi:hypothetical protein
MAITGIQWYWFRNYGNPGASGAGLSSLDINLPPAWIGAQVSLYGYGPSGSAIAGIRQYRRRLPSGADEVIDAGATNALGWPPVVFDYLSSLTIASYVGRGNNAMISVRLDFWN